MSEYQEFTGKTVEEALREARESFDVASLDELDFEILTPGSRGVLGMGAEPARIIAAPRSALGGAAPRREAAAAVPLPQPERPPREGGFGERRERGGRPERGERDRGRGRDRGPAAGREGRPPRAEQPVDAGRPPRMERPERGERGERGESSRAPRADRSRMGGEGLSASEQEEVHASRASLTVEREEIQAADASPEALEAGREILEQLLRHMGYQAEVAVKTGDTAKLDVAGAEEEKEALGALIGRKGERLSALQHLVNLMLSRRMGSWTRVLVDVEDYRGRRERQLREIATRAAERVLETGKMLQLEPMPALERRWIHLALRNHEQVATQSIGEEPQRRVVILRRPS
jgi:spoIIIJ-associated protein